MPVLITKALIEIPPKFAGMPPVNPESRRQQTKHADWSGAKGLAEDVRYYGKWMRDEAEKRIGYLYPKVRITPAMAGDRPDLMPYVGEELIVIAWLWARTVTSPNPAAKGAHVPLVKTFWLSTKPGKKAWIEPVVDPDTLSYHFEVRKGQGRARDGTVGRSGAICVLTNAPIPLEYIRQEGLAKRIGARLMAIVAEGRGGRVYLSPIPKHESIATDASPSWKPDTSLPAQALGFRVQGYGITAHAELFTPRQLVALTTFSDLVAEARSDVLAEASELRIDQEDYADAVATYLAFGVSKMADRGSTLCTWFTERDSTRPTYARQALPMTWDYAETNTLLEGTGSFVGANEWTAENLDRLGGNSVVEGVAYQRNAMARGVGPKPTIVCTDPPYYDNIAYADLSDFFYVWLRRSLGSFYQELLRTLLTPKAEELVASPYRFDGNRAKARSFFEEGLERAFGHMRGAQDGTYPFTIFYAFKQSETEAEDRDERTDIVSDATASTGWETMLEGLIRAGFLISGTWPMRTELGNRIRNLDSNALASSIVLVCRPRSANAPTASRRDFIAALRRELPDALRDLQQGNIAPVDLAQAAIGPGMAVFTRFSKVVESDGSWMGVRTALGLINQALDQVLSDQEGEFDFDTRWAVAWFDQHGIDEGPYGSAETLSTAKNTSVKGLQEAGIVAAKGGRVRLLRRDEMPDDWDPATDKRLTVWEVAQHLIRALDQKGEAGAAALLRKVGDRGEVAKDLAYRLYTTCERKKWAQEALAYNSLVIAWPQIGRLARQGGGDGPEQQGSLFE